MNAVHVGTVCLDVNVSLAIATAQYAEDSIVRDVLFFNLARWNLIFSLFSDQRGAV